MDNQQRLKETTEELLSFGFDKKYIDQVLQITDDKESAVQLIIQMIEDDEKQSKNTNNQQSKDIFNIDFQNLAIPNFNQEQVIKKHKMVFLVRADLKMGIGKIAAQTGHATLGAYHSMVEKGLKNKQYQQTLNAWEHYGQAKIVLRVESLEEFLAYEKKAREAGLNSYIVVDAGHTQVDPGSMTVAAIGPGDSDMIDEITGILKLL